VAEDSTNSEGGGKEDFYIVIREDCNGTGRRIASETKKGMDRLERSKGTFSHKKKLSSRGGEDEGTPRKGRKHILLNDPSLWDLYNKNIAIKTCSCLLGGECAPRGGDLLEGHGRDSSADERKEDDFV